MENVVQELMEEYGIEFPSLAVMFVKDLMESKLEFIEENDPYAIIPIAKTENTLEQLSDLLNEIEKYEEETEDSES